MTKQLFLGEVIVITLNFSLSEEKHYGTRLIYADTQEKALKLLKEWFEETVGKIDELNPTFEISYPLSEDSTEEDFKESPN